MQSYIDIINPGCKVERNREKNITRRRSACQHDRLEPHWEKVGDREVAHCDLPDPFISQIPQLEKREPLTRKLLHPTRTGIFCLSKNGANTGSGETKNSIARNTKKNMIAITRGAITVGSLHYKKTDLTS